ncbi:MAG: zinc carboxypeptidase [Chloroflexi bacterium]|nr:zinc carboxypeptidase [Chloroflexota bacterium]
MDPAEPQGASIRRPSLGRFRTRRLLAMVGVLAIAGSAMPTAASATPPSSTYRKPAVVRAELRAIADAHPDIVQLTTFGTSFKGRPIMLVKISDNVTTDEPEPEIFINARLHAREHLTTEVALALIRWLVDGYGTNERVTRIVNTTEVFIAPDLNPDGAAYDLAKEFPRRWRKNRQPTGGATGTDLNRNFGYRWGCCGGASKTPSSNHFRGAKAFSAPETRAMRRLVKSRQFTMILSLHSYGGQVLVPYGYTRKDRPADMPKASLATVRRLAKGYGKRAGYTPMQASDLYINSGTFGDWAMGKLRLPALTIELAPTTADGGGFYPEASAIEGLVQANRNALLWSIEQAADPSGKGH